MERKPTELIVEVKQPKDLARLRYLIQKIQVGWPQITELAATPGKITR